ncbi:tryptophan--tRNA ligase [Malacoplasma penetrans]|uniref:Tryptophan--tRNA ligase n=1 Tax=Malacoplasma penetrans (strain HF-2) TaxID=272633 RepID=SYW_MALP2|nr:tryptophan--tRNA ligase [Malacoplasma penetrans]Q8EVV1.1 RecName: Full=Tryptophan--tRNA ligase; AltName: Full=Tryptophanyl-tRNA synthetase; Short=TrpRS [Malacoplasma penetrans HF-2]RXY97249.1 tryptophan--tRNA ligase [Malacoplasma penetrans]BAC44248.1 tryptophanyl-tRNA synthetase [Malacoplasma penetrans HF-2]
MKTIVSGIQSTNSLTLGNYLGALKNFINLQNDNKMFIFIADMHSITVDFNPKELESNRKSVASIYAACGLDFDKNIIFYQSSVLAHTQLSYIITCHSYMGELSRMTQFKDKSQKTNANGTTNIPTGLFIYPCLMAADILLYDADLVPVGKDQKQHMELARDIAIRMNKKYKTNLFKIPEIYQSEMGAKIMDLVDPSIKMSKSNANTKGTIFLLDKVEDVRKKIMQAKTDSLNKVKYDVENQPGVSNLMTIYSCLTNKKTDEIEKEFENKNYGEFKTKVADAVCLLLEDIQKKYQIYFNSNEIEQKLEKNAKKCNEIVNKKINLVQQTLGLGTYKG